MERMSMGRAQRQVRFAPTCHTEFDRGVATIVDAIRPTLGPIPRTVAVKRAVSTVSPEILDSGAQISRRITSVEHRASDPGAMFLRGLLFRVNEEVGDGTAMTAVLFHHVLMQGRKAVAAGFSAPLLRTHLERLANDVARAVMAQAKPVVDRETLAAVASSACHDAELAALLGDVADVVGEHGRVEYRPSHRRESWQEFVQGSYWESGLLSAAVFADAVRQRTDIRDAAVLVTNLALDDPYHLVPVLNAAKTQAGGVIIIAKSISSEVKALLHRNNDLQAFPLLAVKSPVAAQRESLADLGVLTGARVFLEEAGDTLLGFTAEHLGRARSAWATSRQFGLVGGMGDARTMQHHVDALVAALRRDSKDADGDQVRQRLGTFQGVTATVWIGASSDAEQKYRTAIAERGLDVVRSAIRGGVVPGGGASLVHAATRLQAQPALTSDPEEPVALRMVLNALDAPITELLQNCGYAPATIVEGLRRAGASSVFDAVQGQQRSAASARVIDPARVVAVAARAAIRAAALALTIDAVVHTASNDISVNPE